jgi:alkanesulfonate monooxygenase SsuD/methylene tetrahydromethanopterin reductase-like flavin-dependent oxidoreductase (luciferase family)
VPELQVGTSAIPVFGRHPLVVSSQALTAQAATHGRYHLGLALGTKLLTEGGFGLPFERPVARLREFLTALRQLTRTGTADFHGELLTAVTPLPARVPGAESGVPLLVAAMGPQALRASGELAVGILPHLAGPARWKSTSSRRSPRRPGPPAGPRRGSWPWCTAWSRTTSTPYGTRPSNSSRSTNGSRPTRGSSSSPGLGGPPTWP